MKKIILALTCLILAEASANSLTLRNNTADEKSAVITFNDGEIFEANIGKNAQSNPDIKLDRDVKSVEWFHKKGRHVANCSLNGLKLSEIGIITLAGKLKPSCSVIPLVKK